MGKCPSPSGKGTRWVRMSSAARVGCSAVAGRKAVRHTLVSQHRPAVPGPGAENIRDRIGIEVCVIEQVVEVRTNLQFMAFPRQLYLLADRRIRIPNSRRTELIAPSFKLREEIDQCCGAGVVIVVRVVTQRPSDACPCSERTCRRDQ